MGHQGWQRLAAFIKRHPRVGWWVQRTYRLVQPRFTIGVVGVLRDGDQVLLVEHVFHPSAPWGLPGGWISRGEDPAQTVEREFREETGLRVQAARLLVVQRPTRMRGHMDVAYECIPRGPLEPIRLSHELLNYRWIAWDALPRLMPLHSQAIRAAFADKMVDKADQNGAILASPSSAEE